jgi:hypothetical protein
METRNTPANYGWKLHLFLCVLGALWFIFLAVGFPIILEIWL